MRANIDLSVEVALTGICLPIALSFALLKIANAKTLQAFAAGAALCPTSLGTTFALLNTSGLTQTRLGTVLTTAAMLDDVVGLVMVQVISDLGMATSSFNAITVVRPVAVSFGVVIVLSLVCVYVVKPLTLWLGNRQTGLLRKTFSKISHYPKQWAFVVHTAILLGLVIGATFAGTSSLFAAYLAGASISWWDSEVGRPTHQNDEYTMNTTTHADAGRKEGNHSRAKAGEKIQTS